MKRLIGLLVVVLLSSLAWTAAHADFLFNSTLVCDSDNDGQFGASADATGRVQITPPTGVTPPGAFKLTMSGLPPGVSAFCSFECAIGPVVQFDCGTANASGRISFTQPGVINSTTFCLSPSPEVRLSTGGICFAGFGTSPHP